MPKKKRKKALRIVTFRSAKDGLWFAEIVGKPETKVSGSTQPEAVGRLVVAKHRHLGLQIDRDLARDT